jgi:hypothetical protein
MYISHFTTFFYQLAPSADMELRPRWPSGDFGEGNFEDGIAVTRPAAHEKNSGSWRILPADVVRHGGGGRQCVQAEQRAALRRMRQIGIPSPEFKKLHPKQNVLQVTSRFRQHEKRMNPMVFPRHQSFGKGGSLQIDPGSSRF